MTTPSSTGVREFKLGKGAKGYEIIWLPTYSSDLNPNVFMLYCDNHDLSI